MEDERGQKRVREDDGSANSDALHPSSRPVTGLQQLPEGRARRSPDRNQIHTDGQPCVNQESKGTARWIGDDLLIEYTRPFHGLEISSKEIWSLSGDGKTLTISSHVSIPQQGEYDVKLIFD